MSVHLPSAVISQQKPGISKSQPEGEEKLVSAKKKAESDWHRLPRECYPHSTLSCLFCFFQSHVFSWLFQYFPSVLTEGFPHPLGSSQEPLSSRNSKPFADLFLTLKMLGSSLSLSTFWKILYRNLRGSLLFPVEQDLSYIFTHIVKQQMWFVTVVKNVGAARVNVYVRTCYVNNSDGVKKLIWLPVKARP